MLFASAGVRAGQGCNSFGDFQALNATYLDASAATGAFICGYYGYPIGFHVRLSLTSFCFSFLLHRDRSLHPWVRCALKMDHAFLVKPLFKRAARRQHRGSEFALFAQYAVHHGDIRVLENN